MTNLLTVVAKVFSNTLVFLLQKCEATNIFFSAKNINVFVLFQDRNFNVMLADNLLSFEQLSPEIRKYLSGYPFYLGLCNNH